MVKNQYNTIDKVFNQCVRLLLWGADKLGTTYNAINVWIFVVIMPIIGIILLGISVNCLLYH